MQNRSPSASVITLAILLAASPCFAQSGGGFFKSLFKKGSAEPGAGGAVNNALQALSSEQVAAGLKEALGKGMQQAVAELGRNDGFLTNLNVRIPMPKRLQRIESGLRRIGQDEIADNFIGSMNRAAEQAVPAAAAIFGDAVKDMSIEDAKAVLSGGDDAATQFFRQATEKRLLTEFRPIVNEATAKTGVTSAYKTLMGNTGFGRKLFSFGGDTDLDQYVTEQSLDGLFKMVAAEELKIRQSPAARTTQTLQSVFGALQKQ